MNKLNNEFDQLQDVINDCQTDVTKFIEGNNSAGTRVRKAMQEVKKMALMSEYWTDKIESSIEVEAWSQKNSTEDKSDLSSLKDLAEDGEIEDGGVTDKDIPF